MRAMRARMYAMNRKMIIVLCCLIAVMAVIIVAGISYLYQGIKTEVVETTEVVESTGTVETTEAEKPTEPVNPTESVKPTEPVKPSLPQEFKVTNCKTNKQNTLRQNKDNSLELIDETYMSLWTIPFQGIVCGNVGEVDFYNNKKIQFLLCDGSSLHLIDRLGREVEGFPKPVGLVVIKGPEKIQHNGVTYWKLDTESGPVYYNYKATKVITQLP